MKEDARRKTVPSIEWDEPAANALRAQIAAAFPSEPFPTAETLVDDARFDDPKQIVEMARGQRWTSLEPKAVVYNRSMSNWTSDQGFVQLLPAYLSVSLDPSEYDTRATTVVDLSPRSEFARERLERRVGLFTQAQRDVILAWLRFVCGCEGHKKAALEFWEKWASEAQR